MKAKYIPNILSVIRILLIPLFVVLFMGEHNMAALAVFLFSGVTDVVDGWLARRFDWITDVGKLLDPLADKLTQCVALLCLFLRRFVPLWLLLFIVVKECLMILGASLLFKKRNLVVSSGWCGKAATVIFYIAVFSIVFFRVPLESCPALRLAIYTVMILAAAFAIVKYYFDFMSRRNVKTGSSPADVGETIR